MAQGIDNRKRARCRGVEIIEFTLVFLPMTAFIFVTFDLGWALYARSTLQYAVREGCRYAITGKTRTDLKDGGGNTYGQVDSIKAVVQQNSMGFLGSKPSDAGWNLIQVNFYDPTKDLNTPLTQTKPGDPAINVGNNIVEVSVVNFQLAPFLPLLRSAAALNFVARSSDRMEATPAAGPPKYSTSGGF
jgi:Flp pilus assembly protein TadG